MQGYHIASYLADSFFKTHVKKSKLLQKEILSCLNQFPPPPLPSSKMGQLSLIPVLPAMRQPLPIPLPLDGICHVHVAYHMTNKISCFYLKVLIPVLMNTRNILINFVKTLRAR